MHNNNHYNKNLREFARDLRTSGVSKAEKYIWKLVLSRKQTGERFLRQRPIFNFIVDFFAPEIGLIIEIDGSSHKNKAEYDFYRQQKLESFEYVLLRFNEGDVIQNIGAVKEKIDYAIFCLKEKKTKLKCHPPRFPGTIVWSSKAVLFLLKGGRTSRLRKEIEG